MHGEGFFFSGQHIFNLVLFFIIIALAVYLIGWLPDNFVRWFYTVLGLSLLYGIFFVLPMAGRYAGGYFAAQLLYRCGGSLRRFLYDKKYAYRRYPCGRRGYAAHHTECKAMNRSLMNVLIGSFWRQQCRYAGGPAKEQGGYKKFLC